MPAPLLLARHLVRVYPNGVRAVAGISLAVDQGECLGLLGPNGAGKTTTLEMLEGLQTPTAGEILFKGRPLDQEYREAIGIQFQSTALQDFQTVGETLRMFARLYRRRTDLDALIRLCHLEDLLGRDTRELSGGQRQRLLLAIALVNEPELVFLDEPTTGLDPQSRRNFWSLIEEIRRRGTTVILTTHYMEEAERLCDRVAIVDQGRIIAEGRPNDLICAHFPAYLIHLPETAWPKTLPLPENAVVGEGEIELPADAVAPRLLELDRLGVDLGALRVSRPNLEDLFLKLTGHRLRG